MLRRIELEALAAVERGDEESSLPDDVHDAMDHLTLETMAPVQHTRQWRQLPAECGLRLSRGRIEFRM